MKGFFRDALRQAWALIYWNARKAQYRFGGADGRAPCQHPSDSGEAGRTGCEAVIGWQDPARFRRVCPLLERQPDGSWRCGVAAAEVRPFWGRTAGWYGGAAAGLVLLAGFAVFGAMRGIGYEVSPRQIFWPPAWKELRGVQAELFLAQARGHFAAGDVRDAVTALGTARELDPRNYAAGMMLAQFHRAGDPGMADGIYAQLLAGHPERATDTARAWYFNLLARGQMSAAMELAAQRLTAEPQQAAAWTHALVFTSRPLQRPTLLEQAASAAGLPDAAARVMRLEARLQGPGDAGQRRQWLRAEPLPDAFPYAWVHRAERMVGTGFPEDALQLLRTARERGILGGRDLVPLALAARAGTGDATGLEREFGTLLARGGVMDFQVLALHLIRYPDAARLSRLLDVVARAEITATEEWQATGLALFCAAGVARDQTGMQVVRDKVLAPLGSGRQAGLPSLEAFFMGRQLAQGLFVVLPLVDPIPLDLLYSLIDKYMKTRTDPDIRPHVKLGFITY